MEQELDLDGTGDGYSGTFRWKKSKILPSMPSISCDISQLGKLNLSRGWMEYFQSRQQSVESTNELVSLIQHDLCFIDCLSTPLTISYLCQHYFQHLTTSTSSPPNSDLLNIICIGASQKAEGRVLLETNCYQEISYNIPNIAHINLYLVGPEMEPSSPRQLSSNLTAFTFQGTSMQFFRSHTHCLTQQTIVIGLNCGYGNWENPLPRRYELTFQWLPDLYFLTGTKLPIYFTCANDYADLIGEIALHQLVFGSYFILAPAENRFGYASTLIPPSNTSNPNEYSRGNSYLYGIQGSDKHRRKVINSGDVTGLVKALKSSKMVACEDLAPPKLPNINSTHDSLEKSQEKIQDMNFCEASQKKPSSNPPPSEPAPSHSSSSEVGETTDFTIHRSIRSNSGKSTLVLELRLLPSVSMKNITFDLSDSHKFFRITHTPTAGIPEIYDLEFRHNIIAETLITKYHQSRHKLYVEVEIRS